MPDLENAMQTIKRVGQPDDIANAVAFLVSELPGFISGEVVHVSGGRFGRVTASRGKAIVLTVSNVVPEISFIPKEILQKSA